MNAETINLVAIVVLGVLGMTAIVAYAYAKRKGDDTLVAALYPYQTIAESLVAGLDKVLAQPAYAAALKPVHEVATAVGTLIDEPTDYAVQLLPGDILSIAQKVVELIKAASDGQAPEPPAQEVHIGGAVG